jgi:hypothetical protein
MDDSKQAKDLAKSVADVEKARLKFTQRSYASLSAIEARTANRVRAAEGGSTKLQVTRSVSKHLHQVSNLNSVLSFAESSQFTPGHSAAFPSGMPLPRTPRASKPAAGSLVRVRWWLPEEEKRERNLSRVHRHRVLQLGKTS